MIICFGHFSLCKPSMHTYMWRTFFFCFLLYVAQRSLTNYEWNIAFKNTYN